MLPNVHRKSLRILGKDRKFEQNPIDKKQITKNARIYSRLLVKGQK